MAKHIGSSGGEIGDRSTKSVEDILLVLICTCLKFILSTVEYTQADCSPSIFFGGTRFDKRKANKQAPCLIDKMKSENED